MRNAKRVIENWQMPGGVCLKSARATGASRRSVDSCGLHQQLAGGVQRARIDSKWRHAVAAAQQLHQVKEAQFWREACHRLIVSTGQEAFLTTS